MTRAESPLCSATPKGLRCQEFIRRVRRSLAQPRGQAPSPTGARADPRHLGPYRLEQDRGDARPCLRLHPLSDRRRPEVLGPPGCTRWASSIPSERSSDSVRQGHGETLLSAGRLQGAQHSSSQFALAWPGRPGLCTECSAAEVRPNAHAPPEVHTTCRRRGPQLDRLGTLRGRSRGAQVGSKGQLRRGCPSSSIRRQGPRGTLQSVSLRGRQLLTRVVRCHPATQAFRGSV